MDSTEHPGGGAAVESGPHTSATGGHLRTSPATRSCVWRYMVAGIHGTLCMVSLEPLTAIEARAAIDARYGHRIVALVGGGP